MQVQVDSAPPLKDKRISRIDIYILQRNVRRVLPEQELGAFNQEIVTDVLVAEQPDHAYPFTYRLDSRTSEVSICCCRSNPWLDKT